MDEISYKTFSGIERVNLTIAAFVRSDNEEIAKLRRTCQLVEYKSMDLEYTRSLEDISSVVACFNMLYMSHCNKFLLIRAGTDANIIAFNTPDKNTFNSKELDEQMHILSAGREFLKFVDDMKKSMNAHLTYIKSAYVAFEQFCVQVGINYEHIIKWFSIPSIDDLPLGNDRMLISRIEADIDCITDLKERFLSYWRTK